MWQFSCNDAFEYTRLCWNISRVAPKFPYRWRIGNVYITDLIVLQCDSENREHWSMSGMLFCPIKCTKSTRQSAECLLLSTRQEMCRLWIFRVSDFIWVNSCRLSSETTHKETEQYKYLFFHRSLGQRSNGIFLSACGTVANTRIIYYSEIKQMNSTKKKKNMNDLLKAENASQLNSQPIFRNQFYNFNIILSKIWPFRFFWFRLSPTNNNNSVCSFGA